MYKEDTRQSISYASNNASPPAHHSSRTPRWSIQKQEPRAGTEREERDLSKDAAFLFHLAMLEGLLLLIDIVMLHAAVVEGICIQAHATRDTVLLGQASLGVEDRVATLSSLDKLRVLLLEDAEVPLGLPVPRAVSSEEKVHLLKSALVGLGVQGPDHGKSNEIGGGKDIVCLFVKGLEHNRAEEGEPSIPQGPANHTPGITLGTDLKREDLSRIQPRDCEPGSTEGGCKEEDHSDSTGRQRLGGRGSEGVLLTKVSEDTSEQKG